MIKTKKSFGHYFKRLHGIMDQIMGREMSDLELTPAQGMIVGYLIHNEQPPCARDLEAYFDLSHPTVSGLLSRMEAKGFVRIRPDDKDRRVKRIYPLEKCYACHKRIHSSIRENDECMVRGFTQEEKELFEKLLKRAVANLEQKARQNSAKREEQL